MYRKNQDLINIGAYPAGSNAAIDHAIALHEPLKHFARQSVGAGFTAAESWGHLATALANPTPPPPRPNKPLQPSLKSAV